ncbi:hypothetical protein FPQ18DRAFT_379898 [Pyronema domesticum]|uniref:Uncharacterized protein n=1 Tax=Pyronema omphalodes (strain CBS 100304) TaxID=1076935 RepID=U4KX90_PYROM|nr:hypothetical protein FPQ18DRAFT_379898 [Pyronema domesticum]CCX06406.1 Protein of unknown function [Pyronema omphalodes CBS 100304]
MKPFVAAKLNCITPQGRFSVQQNPCSSMTYLRNMETYIDSLRTAVIAEYGDHTYRRARNDSGWLLNESLMKAMEKLDDISEGRDELKELAIEAYSRQEPIKYKLAEEPWDDIDPLDITPLTTQKGMEDFTKRLSKLAEERQEMEVEKEAKSYAKADEESNYDEDEVAEPELAEPSNEYVSEAEPAEVCVSKAESLDETRDVKLPALVLESPLKSVSAAYMVEDPLSPGTFVRSLWTPAFKAAPVEINETWSINQPLIRTSFEETVPELGYDSDTRSSTDTTSRSPSIANTPSWDSFPRPADLSKITFGTRLSSDDKSHSVGHSMVGLTPENVFIKNPKSPGSRRPKSRRMSEFLSKANTSITKNLKWTKNGTKSESMKTTINE